jgi:integral membrane protein
MPRTANRPVPSGRVAPLAALIYGVVLAPLSFVLLTSAVNLLAASLVGPVHGTMFLAYVLIALNIRGSARWSDRTTLGVLLGAVLPFGGFVVDRWLAKNSQPSAA